MPIITSDLLAKFSTTAGSAGNSNSGNAAGSLGKYISTTAWAGGSLHDLFDVITGPENTASTVDYRCIFLHNAHGSLTWESVKAWISAQVSGGADFAIGLDPAGVTVIGSSSAQAATIANENAAPSGVTFTAPTDFAGGLSIGNVAAGSCVAVWIRRTAANTAALNNDGATLDFRGQTAA